MTGQFVDTAETPSPSFLQDLQATMAGRSPQPTRHNSLRPHLYRRSCLLARFVLVRRDRAADPCLRLPLLLSPADRRENRHGPHTSTQAGQDTGGHGTCTAATQGCPKVQAPPVRTPPQRPQGQPRQVTFTLRLTTPPSIATTSSSGRPLRNIWPPTQLNL